jgi:uncharacterized protein
MSSWITTASGRRFDIFDFNENDIIIENIATSLSKQCQFLGHCSEFYSVAQHSLFYALLLRYGVCLTMLQKHTSQIYRRQ